MQRRAPTEGGPEVALITKLSEERMLTRDLPTLDQEEFTILRKTKNNTFSKT